MKKSFALFIVLAVLSGILWAWAVFLGYDAFAIGTADVQVQRDVIAAIAYSFENSNITTIEQLIHNNSYYISYLELHSISWPATCKLLSNDTQSLCMQAGDNVYFDWATGRVCQSNTIISSVWYGYLPLNVTYGRYCSPPDTGFQYDLNSLEHVLIPLAVILAVAAVLVRNRARKATG